MEGTVSSIWASLEDSGCLLISLFFIVQVVRTLMPIIELLAKQHEKHLSQIIDLANQRNLGIDKRPEKD